MNMFFPVQDAWTSEKKKGEKKEIRRFKRGGPVSDLEYGVEKAGTRRRDTSWEQTHPCTWNGLVLARCLGSSIPSGGSISWQNLLQELMAYIHRLSFSLNEHDIETDTGAIQRVFF